jgi:hypothetical protein
MFHQSNSQSDCYRQLQHTCQVGEAVSNYMTNADFIGYGHVYVNVISGSLRSTILTTDPLLGATVLRFGSEIYIFKFPAYTTYEWHIDAVNSCSMNCVLDSYDSVTLWQNEQDDTISEIHRVTALRYEPNQWYLFNSQRMHSVINYGDRDRYLLIAGIDKNYSFEEVSKWYDMRFQK